MTARSFRFSALCLLIAALSTAIGAQEEAPALIREQEEAPVGNGRVAIEPFPIGERLVYAVEWDPPWYFFLLPHIKAGDAELWLAEETSFKGCPAYRISFKALASGTLVKLVGLTVDDEFVFHSEPGTFCTFSASSKIREGKRKRQVDVEYLRETRQLHIRELDESVTPSTVKKDEVKEDIPPCVQDPFSALYFFRTSPLAAGYSRTSMLANDDKIREVHSRVDKQEDITVPAGKFAAWKVETVALMGGLFKEGGQFRVWISADDKKLPVQFEVKVKLGRVLGRLKEVTRQNP